MRVVSPEPSSTLEILDVARTLVARRVKQVGGITTTGEHSLTINVPRAIAISAVSTALAGIADVMADLGVDAGLELACVGDEATAVVHIRAPLSRRELTEVATNVRLMLGDAEYVVVRVCRDGIELVLGGGMSVRPATETRADARAQRGILARTVRVA